MLTFTSLDRYVPFGTCFKDETMFAVNNPSDCEDFQHLIGQIVSIDGKCYKVLGVEHYCHSRTYLKGEPIGLLVMGGCDA